MRTAHEVFKGNAPVPGSKVNSTIASKGFHTSNLNFGHNRLTYAGKPQLTTTADRNKYAVNTDRPTQQRIGATGFTGAVGSKIPFNNENVRPLAGSHINFNAKGANSLKTQHDLRATARGISGVNTTSRRGGSSQSGFLKPVAGTRDTFALPGPSGGRNTNVLTKVNSVYHIGLHKIVVTKHVPTNASRTNGALS